MSTKGIFIPEGKAHHINLWFIYIYWIDGLLWFRWFGDGPGYKIKDIRKHPKLFSERKYNGGLQIGNWFIKKLKA